MLAEPLDVVIGVDTHKHTHTAAVVTLTGVMLDHLTVPSDPKGYRRLIAFAGAHQGRFRRYRALGEAFEPDVFKLPKKAVNERPFTCRRVGERCLQHAPPRASWTRRAT